MSDYKLYTSLEQQRIPLQLQRSHWKQLHGWLTNYLRNGTANSSLEQLIKCALTQIYIKVSKQLETLAKKGKAMQSFSTLHFTPLEKYCFRYVFSVELEILEEEQEDTTFFIGYLQPILDRLQEQEINSKTGLSLL
ncbi:hypothetical protein [Aureispira sp. CCB-E]|uniref:hypothetical protein n=1 Tax=Aureispira sp. CCB-E TaxID=3051121 RepID=UPI0028695DE0|nr:hypothetical protein [Aureispira sp. CCB-E]WMX12417.1 hypothetical protein QP953_16430 [Aureispira sp. CCB-E]